MRTCKEIRQDAWKITTGTTWGWKIIVNYIVLMAIGTGAAFALGYAYEAVGIQTWDSFNEAALEARRSGIEMAVPSAREAGRMTAATAFSVFVQYLFTAIMTFGLITTYLSCIKNETKGWFAHAFAGFRRPLELLWLLVLMLVRIFLWSLLFVIPGIIAAFRYMLAWYVKAENPDMSASACLKRSGELMAGRKWAYFALSLSYLGWFALALVPLLVASGISATTPELAAHIMIASGILLALPLLAFAMIYSSIGKAIFYRDAKAESSPATTSAGV